MARCARCGNEKLTEQPCPRCGFRKNADEIVPMSDRQTIIGRLLNVVADQDAKISELEEHIMPPCEWPRGFEPDVSFNMRDWLEKAVRAQGADVTGKGIGPDGADLDIVIDGFRFNVWIHAYPV